MFIRKFYNIDAPAEVAPSIASVMAKTGVLRQPGDDGTIPAIDTEKKEEPITAPATPATATDAKPAGKATPEPPKPTEVTKSEPTHTATTEKAPSWQEVLKTQQPDTILKELGYGENLVNFLKGRKDLDAKLVGFYNHWETNDGNVDPYLKALSTDFSKMAPEDVMKYQLQAQNPELDAKQLDRLYKLKVIDRYKLDPVNYTEEEVEDGRIELMADVKGIRTTLAEQQKNYLFSKPAPKEAGPDPKAQEQQNAEALRSFLNEHPAIKSLMANKHVSFGEGDDKYDFPVDADDIHGLVSDADRFTQSLYIKHENPDGSVKHELDVEKQILIGLVARHGKGLFKQYAQHYKSLGGQSAIAPIENAKPAATSTAAKSEAVETNPAAAAAKHGRLVQGGN